MSPEVASNIRVFIRWKDQTVFAGEDIKCQITFKNVARPSSQHSATSVQTPVQPSPLLGSPRKPSNASNGLAPPVSGRNRGHRSTLSLNVPSSSRSKSGSTWVPPTPPSRALQDHKRSVSIVSIGSSAAVEDQSHSNGSSGGSFRKPWGHGRSASLQINPRTNGVFSGPHSATRSPRRLSGEPSASAHFTHNSFPPPRNSFGRTGDGGVAARPGMEGSVTPSRRKGKPKMPDFKFPMVYPPAAETEDNSASPPLEDFLLSPASASGTPMGSLPVRSRDSIPTIAEHPAPPAARILSTTSIAGETPRSSGEFYSMSNHSSETLASEYVTNPLRNGSGGLFRRSFNLAGFGPKQTETLMMGYAQVQGSFTLDGSLINLGPFEQVKRKAVLGGQGGGVIGLEQSRRDSGIKSFGWGTWGNSIGELLSGGELSTIKEMRGAASSKSVPLLSTPQSILFVDLQLGPGESKSYEYTFRLPRGLPPTHRGRAIKINYSLIIGTQRPGGSKEQRLRSVDIPFRVLGSVNSHGVILGHDLMSPCIILRDQAQVRSVERSGSILDEPKKSKAPPSSSMNNFLKYVDELLEGPRHDGALLSPSGVSPSSGRTSFYEEASTAKEAIDFAIMRANVSSSAAGQSTNRFEIARNGRRVGVVMLARPVYRLGESVSMAIDFTDSEIPCYAVHVALETAERIDPSFALRSEASVHRVTRKLHGSSSEATLFARRVVFNPTIPITASPEFITTGVSLEWKIRIEFVVSTAGSDSDAQADSTQSNGPHPLLEEVARDERGGVVLVAAENINCESFEVAVPLRVYGAVCNGLERLERDEAVEEGLAV